MQYDTTSQKREAAIRAEAKRLVAADRAAEGRIAYHAACGLAHNPERISCDMAANVMDADSEMLGYAL